MRIQPKTQNGLTINFLSNDVFNFVKIHLLLYALKISSGFFRKIGIF